ncbi:MAG: Zn-binding Pro-Ala-Ala-Arg protein involved in TypeVI secretion [Pedosphaera sp.]|nr:Zn-binding Pro-Ala-Ala-Arg protein involved in TypeVI secretion [Pedosphaera sp.]
MLSRNPGSAPGIVGGTVDPASVLDQPAAPTRARAYEVMAPMDKVVEGNGSLAIAMRKAVVDDWYQNHYSPAYKGKGSNDQTAAQKRASLVDATDLTKPVVRRRLPLGMQMIRYQGIDGGWHIHLAYPNGDPAELGINVRGRLLLRYIIEAPFEVLETTSKTIPAGVVWGVGGQGGGKQLIMPPDWERYVRRIWGKPIE